MKCEMCNTTATYLTTAILPFARQEIDSVLVLCEQCKARFEELILACGSNLAEPDQEP